VGNGLFFRKYQANFWFLSLHFIRFFAVFGAFFAVFGAFFAVFGAFFAVFPHFSAVFKDILTKNDVFRGLVLQKLT
jgi:hypothetical protein